jgi:hypothetical protein
MWFHNGGDGVLSHTSRILSEAVDRGMDGTDHCNRWGAFSGKCDIRAAAIDSRRMGMVGGGGGEQFLPYGISFLP